MIEHHHSLRDWFVRHLVAIVATCAVLGLVGWKNQYRPRGFAGDLWLTVQFGEYGWPQSCMEQNSEMNSYTTNAPVLVSRQRSIESWWGLCLDMLVAVAFMVGTWIVFSRTQRRIRRWWQISLPSLIALMALAGILCAIWNTPSFGGG